MPKKFASENTKAVAARARKAAVQNEAQAKKVKEQEDEYWKDEDKHIMRKQQRKEDKEKKAVEAAARKAANKAMAEEELENIKSNRPVAPTKVTRADIQKAQESKLIASNNPKPVKTHLDGELEENVNRIIPEGSDARTVEDAIAVLSVSEQPEDKHPEKRMKAAFTAFEEKNMSRLKKENPNMRLSQVKQLLKKEWMKSPENPMNQRYAQYNAK